MAFKPRHPGSIVFVSAASEWRGWDEGDTVGSYLIVSVDAAFVRQLLGEERACALRTLIGFRDRTIEGSLQRIVAELKEPDRASDIMVESQVIQILVQMVRLQGTGIEQARGGLAPFHLKRVIALLESNLTAPLHVSALAEETGVSCRHFSRAFKQSTGMTLPQFVAELRLERAAHLLRSTDRLATKIALDCGYASASHFASAFKRAHGLSPQAFRKRWTA